MSDRVAQLLVAAASVAVLLAGAGWYHARSALQAARVGFVTSTLEPMASLLKDDQMIIRELQAAPFATDGKGVLQSYLAKLRSDGVPKTAQMKQRLDQLAENNTTLVTLIAVYSPRARTAAFAPAANKFRSYAVAWRDRWNSAMELFMAGGDYPAADVPFPASFPPAIAAEIAATR